MTALDAKSHLTQLETERACALDSILGGIPAFMEDLTEEIEVARQQYTGAAVTEMASLRGELFGRQYG